MKVKCGDDEYPLEVHGESFHQPTLRALVHANGETIEGDRIQATFMVAVRREPTNRDDRNAVAVHDLAGGALGYVPRELAEEYSRAISVAEASCQICGLAHPWGRLIAGDWNTGIWLSLPDADELSARHGTHLRASALRNQRVKLRSSNYVVTHSNFPASLPFLTASTSHLASL